MCKEEMGDGDREWQRGLRGERFSGGCAAARPMTAFARWAKMTSLGEGGKAGTSDDVKQMSNAVDPPTGVGRRERERLGS